MSLVIGRGEEGRVEGGGRRVEGGRRRVEGGGRRVEGGGWRVEGVVGRGSDSPLILFIRRINSRCAQCWIYLQNKCTQERIHNLQSGFFGEDDRRVF